MFIFMGADDGVDDDQRLSFRNHSTLKANCLSLKMASAESDDPSEVDENAKHDITVEAETVVVSYME